MKKLEANFIFIFVFLMACMGHPQQRQLPLTLAIVNGSAIKETDLLPRLDIEKTKYPFVHLQSLAADLLNQMIDHRVITDWGTKQGILLTPDELSQGIKNLKKGYTEREFEFMLEEKNIPLVSLEKLAEETLLVDKIIQKEVASKMKVSSSEITAYYKSHLEDFRVGERVGVRHIVTDTVEKAEKLREQIIQGENFARVAVMYSMSPDRSKGGDLGYFERGSHPKEFDDICFTLKQGELSPVIKSAYGYHLFKLIDKKPEGYLAIEEVEEKIALEIRKQKLEKAYQEWFTAVKQGAQIQVFESALKEMEL